jgi:plasmid replication initiation protein
LIQDLDKAREYKVVKHNDLIQKARYNLSINQQKLIAYVISLIKPTDKDFMMYEISVKDFCELCGLDKNHFYTEMQEILLDLDKKSFLVETEEKIFNFRWFSEFEYIKGQGKIRVQLNSNLKQYLIGLYERFTVYELYNILGIKGKYALRFYELFQSYFNSKKEDVTMKSIDLEELKKLIYAENYKDFKGFRRRVLEPSIKEINEYTDLTVTYDTMRTGKSVSSIRFRIRRKQYPSNYAAYVKTIDRINQREKQIKGQISLFDLNENSFKANNKSIKITTE